MDSLVPTKVIGGGVLKLERVYGAKSAEAINLILHMIRLGNLSGNSWDYFLYRISLGRWGR